MISKFNIRVYGILLSDDKILVSNERIGDFSMLKFPGGGLEMGEGPKQCVLREFKEELNISVTVKSLLHTTETFIQSAFKKNEQVIAIHYIVETNDVIEKFNTTQPISAGGLNTHFFEWRELNENLLNNLTFEMDKQALKLLL